MRTGGEIPAAGIALLAFGAPALAASDRPDAMVVYKRVGGAELKLHVFRPPEWKPGDPARRAGPTSGVDAPGGRAAIVFFFGGGWNGGTPSQFYPHCRYLASRGMVAMSAEYRVKSRHKTTPFECVKDGKSAVRWIRQHAAELGVDPKRVAAGGGSAGGHVAAATGIVKGFEEVREEVGEDAAVGSRPDAARRTNVGRYSARPDALVLFNPVYDNGPGGYGHDRVKARWREISPMHNIDKLTPPTIVFLGTKDKLIPVKTAQKYKELMEDEGVRSDLHLYEGQPHGFFNHRDGKNRHYHLTVIEADRFLASLGFLEGEPTLEAPPLD